MPYVVPSYAYCPNCISWARNKGRLHSKAQVTSGTYTPQPGDIFLREGHTGIIVSVSGSQFTTVEGNTGGTENCRTVGSHTWTFSGGNYDYVFNPAYPDKSSAYGTSGDSYMYSENAYSDTEKEPTVVWNNRVKEDINPTVQNAAAIPSTGELAIYANGVDITKIAGSLSWKNSIYELATTMSFDVAKSDAAYLTDLMYTPKIGDIVQLVTNVEIFRGVVNKVDDGNKDCNKYSVVDLGWYMNKTSQAAYASDRYFK